MYNPSLFAGPIVLNQAEQGRMLEALIYLPLIYVVMPALFILWLVYIYKHFVKHQKSSKLFKVAIVATVTSIVIYLVASPIIELIFGKLEY